MSSGDKTEQASSQKLDKARKQGQIARSKEFSSAIMLMVCIGYFYANADSLSGHLMQLFEVSFRFTAESQSDHDHILHLITQSLYLMIKVFAPLIIFQFIASAIATCLLGGFHFNLSLLAPKFSKINPLSGIKRIFSKQTLVEFLKNVAKISLIFALLYYMISTNFHMIGSLVRASFQTTIHFSLQYVLELLGMLILIAILFGVIDIPYQKMTFGTQMKMTKQEVKQEHKEQEGRPEIKGRIRQIQMQNARRSASQTVPTADVVLMNPTHFAVALKYDLTKAEAPFVVAKGKNEVAFYIRTLAEQHQVEVLVVPEITRSIYHTTQLNQMIPNQLFLAVAQILKYVQQLKSWKTGQQGKPAKLPAFVIPDNLRY